MKKYAILPLSLFFSFELYAQNETTNQKVKEDSKAANTPQIIHIYSEIIEIPALKYAEIMTEPMESTNQTKLRNELIQKVEVGEAKLISNQSITAKPDYESKILSVKEYHYPTEFDSAESVVNANKNTKGSEFKVILPPSPSAFETRYLGSEIEVKPELFNRAIGMDYYFQHVEHTGNHVMSSWNTDLAKVNIEMPNFYTRHTSTSFTVYDNQFTLIGTYNPETEGVTDGSRKLLHFVRASILNVEK